METKTKRVRKVPRRAPSPSVEPEVQEVPGVRSAQCKLCGQPFECRDWSQMGVWFAQHFAQQHPEEFQKLQEVSALFFTFVLSVCFDSGWGDQQEMVIMQEELLEVLNGTRDVLRDGLS